MGLLRRSLVTLLVFLSVSRVSPAIHEVDATRARALDAVLQDYAYRAFVRPKTGVPYDGNPPDNLTGIRISGMRLRSGSLKRRGVEKYKEFSIPKGVIEQPYVTRLVLVYHDLGNWSTVYYPVPNGYAYVAPVLGLLAYDAANLSAKHLPELALTATSQPMSIRFSVPTNGSVPKCVWFDLNGTVNFSDIGSGNVCLTFQQGHFSVVVESVKPPHGEKKKKSNGTVWVIVGSVLGGLGLLVLLGVLVIWVCKCRRKKRIERMENEADAGEALEVTLVGDTRAPSASVTRTQPSLETEYVP